MKNELKPCPFCGSQDCHTKWHSNRYGDVWYGVKCNDCGYENVSKLYDMEVDAIEAWNMVRLIDANVVLAKQFATGLSDASGNYYGHADVVFVDDIENAPTVDAVEVVRCRDCKHSTPPSLLTQRYGVPGVLTCHNHNGPCNKRNVKCEGFCPYGERKDGDGNG